MYNFMKNSNLSSELAYRAKKNRKITEYLRISERKLRKIGENCNNYANISPRVAARTHRGKFCKGSFSKGTHPGPDWLS